MTYQNQTSAYHHSTLVIWRYLTVTKAQIHSARNVKIFVLGVESPDKCLHGRIRSFLFVAHIYYANLQDIQVNRYLSIETDLKQVHCTMFVHSSVCIYSGLCISTTCTKLVNNLTITNCYLSQQSYNAKMCNPLPQHIFRFFNLAIFFFSKIGKHFYKCIFIYPTLILF